jgi:hypothetical protein
MKIPLPNAALGTATAGTDAPPILHQVLTSVRYGINLNLWSISQRELRLDTTAHWSIRKYTLRGGKQEGVEVVEVDNGRLRFVVVPTRGMSVLKVESGDVRLGWDSPVKDVVHPKLINLESRGGLGWLEGFNEWMVRCGLEWAGHPGRDRIRNNSGDEIEMELTLSIDAGSPPRIHIRGLVEERMFHGPKLSFIADISTAVGSNSLRFDDAVTNQGVSNQEFQIIYHANYGPPLLGAGSTFWGPVEQVKSFNSHAAKNAHSYANYSGPQPGFVEEAYCLQPLAGQDGRTELMLHNVGADRGVSMIFPVDQLPCVTLWKNLAAEADGYVTGIEPGTGFPFTRRLEREAGRVPKLAPNETRRFTIDVEIHPDRDGVEAAKRRIQKIQGEMKTTVDGGSSK